MILQIGMVLLTAVLSSLFTVLLIRWWVQRAVDEALGRAGREIEDRVRSGASQAAESMLPELQTRVRAGFEDAMVSLASGGSLERFVDEAKRSGARSINEGLGKIFGRKRED